MTKQQKYNDKENDTDENVYRLHTHEIYSKRSWQLPEIWNEVCAERIEICNILLK